MRRSQRLQSGAAAPLLRQDLRSLALKVAQSVVEAGREAGFFGSDGLQRCSRLLKLRLLHGELRPVAASEDSLSGCNGAVCCSSAPSDGAWESAFHCRTTRQHSQCSSCDGLAQG